MMKQRLLHIILILSIFGCESVDNSKSQSIKLEHEFTTISANKAIEIAENLSSNNPISEDQWERLFKSVGYKNYLVYSDSSIKKELIKDALITVFDPRFKKVLDSLLAVPVELDLNYFKLSLIQNFYGIKDNLDSAKEFLNATDFNNLIASGDSLAKEYLPKAIQDSIPELYDIHMIMSDPDAKVMDGAIVFDLNMAMESGEEGLIKIIAHEYHHNYRKLTAKSYDHPLMIQLNKIHREGVADLIDKDEPPVDEMGLFPKLVIDSYNEDYANTPQNLRQLDLLTNRFIKQEIDTATYFGKINNYFKFGGHTTGIYMSFKIAKKLNKDVLIESLNDPLEFIKIYNQIAQVELGDHVFSNEFIQHLEQLDE